MKMLIFEGTAEEISAVMQNLPLMTAEPIALTAEPAENRTFVTVEFARRMLTRLDLSEAQHRVLQALYAAYPTYVVIQTLQAATGYTPRQFSGLMGAFGNRMAQTEGYQQGSLFFDYRWNGEAQQWEYRLPESVHEAVSLENLV